MRKIDKDKSPDGVPVSLRLPDLESFADGFERRKGNTTHEKRLDVIAQGKYIQAHSDRYKQADTQDALVAIYHEKCAYCEQRVEAWHVEHYRPKSVYYWLAFSWDNLLLICPTCNSKKRDHFDCEGASVTRNDPPFAYNDIHNLLPIYDAIQRPKFVNPEVDDLSAEMIFDRNGSVCSDHPRMAYTIERCQLDRRYLNDDRRKILDDFKKTISGEFLKYSLDKQKVLVKAAVEKLESEALDPKAEFTAFRRYMLQNWLKEEILSSFSRI